jgi:hypothetical protein
MLAGILDSLGVRVPLVTHSAASALLVGERCGIVGFC